MTQNELNPYCLKCIRFQEYGMDDKMNAEWAVYTYSIKPKGGK